MKHRNWKNYAVGDRPFPAIIITEILLSGSTQTDTRYQVVWDCCGLRKVMSHKRITQKQRLEINNRCRSCAHTEALTKLHEKRRKNPQMKCCARRPTEDYGITRPDWAVPAGVPLGVNLLWCDGMRK